MQSTCGYLIRDTAFTTRLERILKNSQAILCLLKSHSLDDFLLICLRPVPLGLVKTSFIEIYIFLKPILLVCTIMLRLPSFKNSFNIQKFLPKIQD